MNSANDSSTMGIHRYYSCANELGHDDETLAIQSLHQGAQDYLTKDVFLSKVSHELLSPLSVPPVYDHPAGWPFR